MNAISIAASDALLLGGRIFFAHVTRDVEASVTSIGADVAEMKLVTDEVKRWKLMGIGVLGVTGIAAMGLGVRFAEAIRGIVFVVIGKG